MTDITIVLESLGLTGTLAGTSTGQTWYKNDERLESYSPVDGKKIGSVSITSKEEYEKVIQASQEAFKAWRKVPAPKRGEIVRLIGESLREKKEALGTLVSYEMGKSLQEGMGEVQEMIDICDFAVGLSRQLYGLTIQSERPEHRMFEQ
ncbi:MAG: aldehyde dehydrogenase family protein, partial [Cyclobacteriaceae bacterium]|nr:aldehyde dehydrogenase family protein [Cyclobacteriaceae bacterium]